MNRSLERLLACLRTHEMRAVASLKKGIKSCKKTLHQLHLIYRLCPRLLSPHYEVKLRSLLSIAICRGKKSSLFLISILSNVSNVVEFIVLTRCARNLLSITAILIELRWERWWRICMRGAS